MKRVYFIPGLGADERLYAKLNLAGIEEHYLNWIDPEDCVTMGEYADRYVPMIDTSEPFYLVGTSMGGMMAIELQKRIRPEKMVLISTVKTRHEFPIHLRTIARTRINTLVSGTLIQNLSGMIDVVYPWQTATQRDLFLEMLNNCTPKYLKFAINACINWDNEILPTDFLHLHGSRDPLFPASRAIGAEIIEGGNHFMVYEMGEEVSRKIQAFLDAM
jgi:pimeloyl-ACP methyl ester carboxylesterase